MGSYKCCSSYNREHKQINSLSSLLQLVGENNRLQILCILRQGRHCVCEINKHIKASQSLISHHLRDLKDGGLIIDEKQGLRVYYSLTKNGEHVTNLLFQISSKVTYTKSFDKLKEVDKK